MAKTDAYVPYMQVYQQLTDKLSTRSSRYFYTNLNSYQNQLVFSLLTGEDIRVKKYREGIPHFRILWLILLAGVVDFVSHEMDSKWLVQH